MSAVSYSNKLLFLDVDGVLNNHKIIQQQGMHGLGCKQLSLLKQIVAGSCCEIVLSSTWRLYEDLSSTLSTAFDLHLIPRWIDITPDLGYCQRRDEILSWLVGHEQPAKIAVIDDDKDAMVINAPQRFGERIFVQTDFNYGMQHEHAEAILEFFRRPE